MIVDYIMIIFLKNHLFLEVYINSPHGSVGKGSACNAGDTGEVGSVPGSGRSPGEGNGTPFQYCCLKNPTGRGDWKATVQRDTESDTAD